MRVLVTGGAGYIGSFMVRRLLDEGVGVVVIDNLSSASQTSLDTRATFTQGDILDKSFLDGVFSQHSFDAVMHFAGVISMAESMENPERYFEINTVGALCVLSAMQKHGVKRFIFSSTAGVYGTPLHLPINEDHETHPENPYGESKRIVEIMLSWFAKIHGFSYVSLRYFNAAGAALDGTLGEMHKDEGHIIPLAIQAAILRKPFVLFGTNYETPDGTCIRDYIHVLDLAQAHMLSLRYIEKSPGGVVFNVGTGRGYSNKEVIDMVQKVSGVAISVVASDRRPGDVARLIADPTRIMKDLGFSPQYSDLETIVRTAWVWHTKIKKQE